MATRRRFLQDTLRAAAGAALLPVGRAAAGPAAPAPAGPVTFDLHAHPGAFFARGQPYYVGDDSLRGTVRGMRDGGLTGAFFSLVADAPLIDITPTGVVPRRTYAAGEATREYARQLAFLRAQVGTTPARVATTVADLERAHAGGTVAAFLGCEGGEFLDGDAGRVAPLHADGVRSLQLVHYAPSALGDLQTAPAQHGGLSALGKAVVRRMNAVGMLVDVAHASFATVRDVVALTTAPVILSHSLLRADPGRMLAARTITVEHARLVASTGGVIGAWPSAYNATFDEFVDHTKRLVDAVGIDHVGLGTDMDGNLRPVFTAYAQLADWARGLEARGFTRAEAEQVLGGNVVRVLRAVLG